MAAIRYSPQVASYKLKMDLYEFLDRALKGEVRLVLPTMGDVYYAEPGMIQAYLNSLSSDGRPQEGALPLDVEQAELERFSLTLGPGKWPSSLPFMDPDHPCFAPELEAAVSAWAALFSAGDNSKLNPPEQLKRWLKQHRQTLSKAAIERLSIVANYRKSRGPKKN